VSKPAECIVEPTASDVWRERARPVAVDLLLGPRRPRELTRQRVDKHRRHSLAWLEEQGLAIYEDGLWMLTSTGEAFARGGLS
jgi:hypothetical protein